MMLITLIVVMTCVAAASVRTGRSRLAVAAGAVIALLLVASRGVVDPTSANVLILAAIGAVGPFISVWFRDHTIVVKPATSSAELPTFEATPERRARVEGRSWA